MMTYLLVLLYVTLIYVRPGEIVPQWAGLPIVAVAGGAAAVSAAVSLFREPRRFVNLPNDWCFLGFILASVLSFPANGWLGGAYVVLVKLQPLLIFYLLIRIGVRTDRQLRGLVLLLIALTLFQATNGIVQYWTGTGFGSSTAVVEAQTVDESNLLSGSGPRVARRIRGTGIFGDPNDLAMSLVVVLPFLFSAMLSPNPGLLRRAAGLGALAVLLYALYLTQSRGGLLGLAAVGAVYAYRRLGRLAAAAAGVVVLLAALVAGSSSRLQQMDSSEASAQGRIQAWAAGMEMLRSQPILGVGVDQFITRHERAAHNSFVHVFAETGLVGGYFFVGMFYWFLVGSGSSRNAAGAAHSRRALELWASGIGVIACACFLSRQYSPVLYVPLALGAARISVERSGDRDESFQKLSDWLVLAVLSCGLVAVVYLAVRMLAVWSGA